ncbi:MULTISPECIES: hypothetical protein, partial [unclassified Ornithinimicrobium]|uniref:hypothetical protein n=1 Tax=unclassified Ornithinimicrobium TaxID=2615080 RepID=UPI0038555078
VAPGSSALDECGVGGVRPILENSTACQIIDANVLSFLATMSCRPRWGVVVFVRLGSLLGI